MPAGMQTLADLLFPITPEQFRAEYEGRKPLHVPAPVDTGKADLLTWNAFNGLLNKSSLWTAQSLLLMLNALAVQPEQYCREVMTPHGPVTRPWPEKVEVFLGGGASLVANDVLYMHEPVTRLGQALGEAFAANIGANVYCSFQGVQAFGSHYDVHDVFVIQTEGEKVWTLYETRADNPIEPPPGTTETLQFFQRSRGAVATQITMKAGDVLYLPRGVYHDALATDGPSLHITYAVTPFTGRSILSVLDTLASQQSSFRAYLAPADLDEGAVLKQQLAALSETLSGIMARDDFLEAVGMAQRQALPRSADFTLPVRKPATVYRTTGRAFPAVSPGVRPLYDWIITERRFSLEDMIATFGALSPAQVEAAIHLADQAGAVMRD